MLHRDSQALRCLCAETTLQERSISFSRHSHGRARSAACPRVSPHAGVYSRATAKKEGGSLVWGTQESDRLRRLRRLKFVREQFFLAATTQNIKRLVRF